MTRGAACLRRSGGSENPVARVTQAQEDVAVVVEAAVDGGGLDGHVGVPLVHRGDALGAGQQADEFHRARLERLDFVDGGHGGIDG